VKREWVLLPSVQTPPPANPPAWWPYSLVAGLVFGALFALSGRAGAKNKLARVFFGLMLAIFGLVAGFFGIFFLAAWAFTDHVVGYHNENVLLCVPWAIWLVGTGPRLAFGRAKSMIVANKLLTLALAATALDLVLKVTPWFDQKNGFFLVFFVPLWAGAVLGARALAAHARTTLAVAGAGATKATTPAVRKKRDASGTDDTLKAETSDEPAKPSPSMKPSKVERKPAKKSTPSDAKVDANAETKSEAKRAPSKKEIVTGLEETVAAGDLEATKKAGGADLDATRKSESEPPPAADQD
jgi:hypothetical protein